MYRMKIRGAKGLLLTLVAVMTLVAAISASPVFGAGEQGLDRADQVRQRHTDELMAIKGVVGVALGLNPAGKAAVVVLIKEPGVAGIPNELEGVPVHVRLTGEIFALPHKPTHNPRGDSPPPDDPPPPEDPPLCDDPTDKCPRPVPTGVSTGHPAITAGTIGARVTDGTNVYALSNNHIYAASNSASIGDAVIQPGTFDGGTSDADDIGTLSAFELIVFSTSANNVIDAAIALSSTASLGNTTPSSGYGTPRSATVAPSINLRVMKYGRTTEETKGRVSAINATVNVNYGSPGVARFVDQIIIEPGDFSAGGDSGSLIVVDGKGPNKAHNRKPVGLLFAGSFFVTIANPIDPVLNRFGVIVDGE